MERISIKRSLNSVDGKLINYLNSCPLGMSSTEAILLALRAYWLPLALQEHGQSSEDIYKAAIWAIPVLQAQVHTISLACKIESNNTLTFASPVTQPSVSTTLDKNLPQQQQEDDTDDWDMNLQLTDELIAVNQALGEVN